MGVARNRMRARAECFGHLQGRQYLTVIIIITTLTQTLYYICVYVCITTYTPNPTSLQITRAVLKNQINGWGQKLPVMGKKAQSQLEVVAATTSIVLHFKL